MNKFCLGLMACVGLVFGACDSDTKDTTQEFHVPTYNLVENHETGETVLSTATYDINLNYTEGSIKLGSTDLTFDNRKHTFATQGDKFGMTNLGQLFCMNFNGIFENNSNMAVSGPLFMLTPLSFPANFEVNHIYTPVQTDGKDKGKWVNGAVYTNNYGLSTWAAYSWLVTTYNIGHTYTVKALIPDAFYFGTTQTVDDKGNDYENKDAVYRVIMDYEKKVANILIYNVQFAAAAPKLVGVYLKDLPVTFANGTYSIDAANVVPYSVTEDIQTTTSPLVPFEGFTFDSFKLVFTNAYLTSVKMDYTVAGKYTGSFEGQSVVIPEVKP